MYVPDIQVHATCNVVTLVWGSLRFAHLDSNWGAS